MAGRAPLKTYQYSEEGKFLQEYQTHQEVREKYYFDDIGKRPLFSNRKDYMILPNGTFLTKERIGRLGIIEIKKRINNPFVKIDTTSPIIEVFNVDNKVIATFRDIHIASKLTTIPFGTIYNQLNRASMKGSYLTNQLSFKYKK